MEKRRLSEIPFIEDFKANEVFLIDILCIIRNRTYTSEQVRDIQKILDNIYLAIEQEYPEPDNDEE